MGQHKQRGITVDAETDLVEETFAAQEAVTQLTHAWHAPEWLELELSITQVKALIVLDCHPAITIGQLACKLGLAKPAASILVDKLVQAGYIERTEDAEDRRRTNIRLSTTGAELVYRLMRVKREQMRALLARMAPADLRALCQGLRALATAAGQAPAAVASAPCANVPVEPMR